MTYTPLQSGSTPSLGTSGDAVKAYQTQLNTTNANQPGYTALKVDGLYGPLTQAASQYKAPAPKSYPVMTSGLATDKSTQINNTLNQPSAGKSVRSTIVNADGSKTVTYMDGSSSVLDKDNQILSENSTGANALNKYLDTSEKSMDASQQAYDTYNSTISKIYAGDLTASEQAQLDDVQKQYDSIKNLQAIANKSTEGIAAEFGNRLGLNVGSPLQAQGYVDVAINTGLARVAEIQSLADTKKAEMRELFKKNKLGQANDAYNAYMKLSEQKTKALNDTYKTMTDYENSLRDYNLKVQNSIADEAYRISQLEQNDYQFEQEMILKKNEDKRQSQELASKLATDDVNRRKILKEIDASGGGIASGNIPSNLDLSNADVISKLPVSTLTKAAMAGTIKLKDLTPTDKAKVASEMYQVGFNPNNYVVKKLSNLATLWEAIPEDKRGLLNSFITPFATNIDPSVAEFESAKQVINREIARLNDVGMLSDQDVADYAKSMPSRSDESIDVVNSKIKGLSAAVAGKTTDQYSSQRSQLQKGEILVKDKDGKIGALPENEFNSKEYTKL